MENGEWRMENGEWRMENGKWKIILNLLFHEKVVN
jgi:hypothetical protein